LYDGVKGLLAGKRTVNYRISAKERQVNGCYCSQRSAVGRQFRVETKGDRKSLDVKSSSGIQMVGIGGIGLTTGLLCDGRNLLSPTGAAIK
jgi:hypothetical protein